MSSFQWRMTSLAVMAVATVSLRDRPQPSFVQPYGAVELHLHRLAGRCSAFRHTARTSLPRRVSMLRSQRAQGGFCERARCTHPHPPSAKMRQFRLRGGGSRSAAYAEGKADVFGPPALDHQVGGDNRPNGSLHTGQKEVEPIQSKQALLRGCSMRRHRSRLNAGLL